MEYRATAGQTTAITVQLLADGAAALIQGFTVSLILTKADGTVVTTTGNVTNRDDGSTENRGKVEYAPDAADLVQTDTPHAMKWRTVDASGFVAYWPEGSPDTLRVYKA